MKKHLSIFILIGLLSACSDSIPEIPEVSDPHNIIVNGTKMKQLEFIKKYCVSQPAHQTCNKVRNAMVLDSTKGEVPQF